MMLDWSYDAWPSGEPYTWEPAARGMSPYDSVDFHVDLGCGKLKKGRIGIDRFAAPGVNVVMDLDTLRTYAKAPEPGRDAVEILEDGTERFHWPDRYGDPLAPLWVEYPTTRGMEMYAIGVQSRLPFSDNSIKSVISHHALEHIGDGFVGLVEEVYRVLEPGGLFRAITPLFPSRTAVEDPDHRRYFMEGTWETFGGKPGEPHWHESFAVPYTTARFTIVDKDVTPALPLHEQWGPSDAREIRVAMVAEK